MRTIRLCPARRLRAAAWGDVAEFACGVEDAAAGGFADPDGAGVVQDVGDGGAGDAGEARDVGARGHGAGSGRRGGGVFGICTMTLRILAEAASGIPGSTDSKRAPAARDFHIGVPSARR
ncbi:hypothetical protein GCM10020256_05070 [Streptomyces thermocoprophilus]